METRAYVRCTCEFNTLSHSSILWGKYSHRVGSILFSQKEGQVTGDQQPTHTVRKSWKETWVFFIPLHRWWGQRDPAPERDLSINLVCSPVCCVTPSFILQGGQDPQTTFSCLLISILNHRQSSFVSESALKCGGFDFKVFWSYHCLPHPIRIPAKFT